MQVALDSDGLAIVVTGFCACSALKMATKWAGYHPACP